MTNGKIKKESEKRNKVDVSNFDLIQQQETTFWGEGLKNQLPLTKFILKTYENATHIVLLSGTCVPVVTPRQLLQELSRDERSRIGIAADSKKVLFENETTHKKQYLTVISHHANFILSRFDAEGIETKCKDFEKKYLPTLKTKGNVLVFPHTVQEDNFMGYPDEVFIGTVLLKANERILSSTENQEYYNAMISYHVKTDAGAKNPDLHDGSKFKQTDRHYENGAIQKKARTSFVDWVYNTIIFNFKDTKICMLEYPFFFRKVINFKYNDWKIWIDRKVSMKEEGVVADKVNHEAEYNALKSTPWKTIFDEELSNS